MELVQLVETDIRERVDRFADVPSQARHRFRGLLVQLARMLLGGL